MIQQDNGHDQERYLSTSWENDLGIFEAIVASSDDAIVSKTLNGIITSWNKAAERMFGYSAQEAIGQSITLIIPTELHHEEVTILEKLRRGEHIDHYETVRQRKDGSRIEVSLSISPVKNRAGKIIGAAKIARDISERKELERRKDEFLSITSHELKTPMTTLKGLAQLLLRKGERQELQDSMPLLLRMNAQVDRLTRLVNDVLDASAIQSGHVAYKVERVDLAELVQETIELMQPTAPTHTLAVDLAAPVWMKGDKDRLAQVIINLVSNAIKYSPQGSTVEISLTAAEGTATLMVRDYGVGIPKAAQRNLFERFYRVPGPQVRTVPGLGLGLYIAYEIVRRHGGEIKVESEEQQGTTFWITLPCDAL